MATIFISQKIYGFNSVETKFIIPNVLVVIICNMISPHPLSIIRRCQFTEEIKLSSSYSPLVFIPPNYPAPTIFSYNEFASQQLRNVLLYEVASIVLFDHLFLTVHKWIYIIIGHYHYEITLHQSLVLSDMLKMQSPDCSVSRLFLRVLFAVNNSDKHRIVSGLRASSFTYCVLQKQQIPQIQFSSTKTQSHCVCSSIWKIHDTIVIYEGKEEPIQTS